MRSAKLMAGRAAAALVAVALAAVAGGCGGDGEAGDGTRVWRHGVIKPKGDAEFSAVFAREKGFFRQHGVDIRISEFEGSLQLTQALLAGQLDSAENNADPVLRAISEGGDVTAIASTITSAAYNLYSDDSTTSFEELEGKTVGVSKPGAFPDLITRAMASQEGIDPDSITLVNAGDDATRYKALVAGRVDATAASVEFAPQAQRDGLNILGEASEIVPEWPRFFVWANPKSLEQDPEAAVGFLAGLLEGLNYALDNKEEAIRFVAELLRLPPDDQRLTFTYGVQAPLVSRTGEIAVDKLEFVANFLTDIGVIRKPVEVTDYVDTSFQERAAEQADVR
jgi:NitT/TauT family transport system substrate-binding protein